MSATRYIASTILKDTETRLIIPSKEVLIGGLLTGFANQLITNAAQTTNLTQQRVLETAVRSVLSGPLLTLGVTDVRVRGKLIVPTTKGIGSVGEILHLIGSKNEIITIKFTTDKFPGPMSSIIKKLIEATLDQVDVVYIVDDLLSVAACILIDYDLQKVGRLKSAVIGELKLIALNTGTPFGLASLGFTFLNTLAVSAISNTITELSQPFKWMGALVRDKSNRS